MPLVIFFDLQMKLFLIACFLFVITSFSVMATHLRAGEITVRRDGCSNRFWITITAFTNTKDTKILFGGDGILDFGDTSDPDRDGKTGIWVPEQQNIPFDPAANIATASYTISHEYAAGNSYLISYTEPNRNEGVLNMDQSVNTPFYIETYIKIDNLIRCDQHTAVLGVPPIDKGCVGVTWSHNPSAYDLDEDSLSYDLVTPFRDRNTPVVNYRAPNNPAFYQNFGQGNENKDGQPEFNIDHVKGTITWDAPGKAGEYNIAFVIRSWRKVNGSWVQLSFVRRDMQIIIDDCTNQRPDLDIYDVCVEAGQTVDETFFGSDPDKDDVVIEAFSEILNLQASQNPATYSPNPPIFQSTDPGPAAINFKWQTKCEHVKQQKYSVVFKITDKPKPGSGSKLVTFKVMQIQVVGPKPKWSAVNAIVSHDEDRSVDLKWDPYNCSNAEKMQVWRRVDSFQYASPDCITGMPDIGYQLIAEVPIGKNIYHDSGLSVGAVYCYRLVAIFPLPKEGKSYVSDELCTPPFAVNVPLLTNVTVDTTSTTIGQITVGWLPPFEADQSQFPAPYRYEVYRGVGLSGSFPTIPVATVNTTISDPLTKKVIFVDKGLDTESKSFHYGIKVFSANSQSDTSAVASSVTLETKSKINEIDLSWSAQVPWSIDVAGLKHKIYRGAEGSLTWKDLTLIDSVNVASTGFIYQDSGQYQSTKLAPGRLYCYVVETLGSYGNDNPNIKTKEPFHNFSQMVCAAPNDTIPPCQASTPVNADATRCEDILGPDGKTPVNAQLCYSGSNGNYENHITWERIEDDCASDVSYYIIYYSPRSDVDFLPLLDKKGDVLKVKETSFTHSGLTSFAGCYKIAAVDRSGNIGEQSESICIDNCLYYELPNVFSPNGDGCNDLFSAYNDRTLESENCVIPDLNRARCPRFVDRVHFKVFNRWGKQVYEFQSKPGGENTIYIDWNGKAANGGDLSPGVYYYSADVTFITSDPSKEHQTIKGWVTLIR
jgi:hypothetical protein